MSTQFRIDILPLHTCTVDIRTQMRKRGLRSDIKLFIETLVRPGNNPTKIFNEVQKLYPSDWVKKDQIESTARGLFAKINVDLPAASTKKDTPVELAQKVKDFVSCWRDTSIKTEYVNVENFETNGFLVAVWCETARKHYAECLVLESCFHDDTYKTNSSDCKVSLIQCRTLEKSIILVAYIHSKQTKELYTSMFKHAKSMYGGENAITTMMVDFCTASISSLKEVDIMVLGCKFHFLKAIREWYTGKSAGKNHVPVKDQAVCERFTHKYLAVLAKYNPSELFVQEAIDEFDDLPVPFKKYLSTTWFDLLPASHEYFVLDVSFPSFYWRWSCKNPSRKSLHYESTNNRSESRFPWLKKQLHKRTAVVNSTEDSLITILGQFVKNDFLDYRESSMITIGKTHNPKDWFVHKKSKSFRDSITSNTRALKKLGETSWTVTRLEDVDDTGFIKFGVLSNSAKLVEVEFCKQGTVIHTSCQCDIWYNLSIMVSII